MVLYQEYIPRWETPLVIMQTFATCIVILFFTGSVQATVLGIERAGGCTDASLASCAPNVVLEECRETQDACCPVWRQRFETDVGDWLDCKPQLG
jgi:hypothetical protein